MKPAPFAYHAPDSVEAALELAARHGPDARWLAGGQSLVPAMNFRLVEPAVLLDLNELSELDYVEQTEQGGVRIGALARQRRVEHDPAVARLCPLLGEAMPHVAHPQIRNRGTMGGSMVHADPAAELPVVAVALDARFRIRSADDERFVAADDFFQGLFTVDLAPDEMLVEVEFPRWPAGAGWSFLEVARRHGDYALAGVAALLSLDDSDRCRQARLVYLNVGDRPVDARRAARQLQGERVSDEAINAVARTAADEEINPVADVHASAAYQRHLARVLTVRALRQALARATNGSQQEG